MSQPLHPRTGAVRAGIESDTQHGAVVPPLHLSSNFSFAGFDTPREFDYTRSGNPTRATLARALAELEGAAGGVVTASGMAAVHLVLSLLEPGSLVVAAHDCYGGTQRLLRALDERGAYRVRFARLTRRSTLAEIAEAEPSLIWAETPSNPLMRVTDIEALAKTARRANALLAVDNTFLSPALQQPLLLGADLVVHSTTKYINGHSDVVGGAALARTPLLADRLEWWANCLGLGGAPFDSFLTLRGLRTLHARMSAHERGALAIARRLAVDEAVSAVHYPGLVSHPDHALARRQQRGYGGMLSFELAGGEVGVRAFLEGLRLFLLAESLGGVESLVAHPATMTHAAMSESARREAGIGPGLLRLSVGIEHPEDLLAELDEALDRVARRLRGACTRK